MPALPAELLDPQQLRQACAGDDAPIAPLREACVNAQQWLDSEFSSGLGIEELIHLRAAFVDELLGCIWERFDWGASRIALAAVGGYGRGELHPHSDIDLLVLIDDQTEPCQSQIEQFLRLLWDVKLDIGHAVRTAAECRQDAGADITVVTSLMESRLIRGSQSLLDDMRGGTGVENMWPSADFFRAKWDEQRARHGKYADTEYNLEPNVKSSPGGLRDIQTIGWIALRQYGVNDPRALKELGFLTGDELDILINGRNFLWRVRYALHMISGREEDRLLFDHQRELAGLFGYEDSDMRLAV